MSSNILNFEFAKTQKFSNFSGSNRMESFESCPSCAGEVQAACRFERKARLRLSVRVCIANSVVSAADGASPKAQRSFPKLDILPNNIFLNAEQRRIGKTYTRVDIFCGGA